MKKPKSRTCNCRRKSRNNPKVGAGICYLSGHYRHAVELRIQNKRKSATYLHAARTKTVDDIDD
jgi:hypothetical protein